jgi:exopolysaccharide biosynthesis polyprenyl glycosylphosphotransferase
MPERTWADHALVRFVTDIVLTVLALFLAGVLASRVSAVIPLSDEQAHLPLLVYGLVAVIWGVAFVLTSFYLSGDRRAIDEAQALFALVTLATFALAGLLFFAFRQVSRLQIVIFYILDLILLIGFRLAVRLSRRLLGRPRYSHRRVLIIGAGEAGREAALMISNRRWAGLDLLGFLDNEIPPQTKVEGYPVLGTVGEIDHYIEAEGAQEIVIAVPLHAYPQFFRLLDDLRALPVQVRIVPDYIKTTLFRAKAEEFAGIPMITVLHPTLAPFERQVKRAFDLIVGAIALILASPLLALVAISIRLDSPGPVIFKQQRVGENGRLFWMYKFRSMVQDAEQQQSKAIRIREDGQILHKHPNDPRVTRVGKFIRRTSLDELPQIFNVLKGEMSLVGPRPELPWLVERYEPWQWQRFYVPQGITGWWQVNGRSDKPMHLYTDEDLFYIQHYSLFLDIQILWRTVGAVLKSRGAY